MHYDHTDLRALDEVEDLLEAYAEARLAPAGPVLSRIRTAVLTEAATEAARRRAAGIAAAARRPRFTLPRFRVPQPAFALGFAAVLTLGTAAAVMAAPPGSPFYDARLYIETALLPPTSNFDARLAAYGEQFDRRLAEAGLAAAHGDRFALAAALTAYQADVTAAMAEIGTDAAQLTLLEDMLGKHVDVLEALDLRLPEQAAIENALANSQKAVEKIKDKKAHPNGRPSAPPGQNSNPPSRP